MSPGGLAGRIFGGLAAMAAAACIGQGVWPNAPASTIIGVIIASGLLGVALGAVISR